MGFFRGTRIQLRAWLADVDRWHVRDLYGHVQDFEYQLMVVRLIRRQRRYAMEQLQALERQILIRHIGTALWESDRPLPACPGSAMCPMCGLEPHGPPMIPIKEGAA